MELYTELRQLYVSSLAGHIVLQEQEDGRMEGNRAKQQQALVKFKGVLAQMQTIIDEVGKRQSCGHRGAES